MAEKSYPHLPFNGNAICDQRIKASGVVIPMSRSEALEQEFCYRCINQVWPLNNVKHPERVTRETLRSDPFRYQLLYKLDSIESRMLTTIDWLEGSTERIKRTLSGEMKYTINSLGEIQTKGVELDRLAGERALALELLESYDQHQARLSSEVLACPPAPGSDDDDESKSDEAEDEPSTGTFEEEELAKCNSCDALIRDCEEQPMYECNSCGNTFGRDDSPNGNHQCECGKWASRLGIVCPECGEDMEGPDAWTTEKVATLTCSDCGETFETEGDDEEAKQQHITELH